MDSSLNIGTLFGVLCVRVPYYFGHLKQGPWFRELTHARDTVSLPKANRS